MSFRLVDEAKKEFPVHRLCRVLGVSQSGYFAWKRRPACRRQHEDMVLLAHVRSAFALSNGTYGSPRMTRELRDDGLTVGRRRTARLMQQNGLRARQKRRFKRTTDSHHAWRWRPTCSIRILRRQARTRNGAPTSPTSGPRRARADCLRT
jgi:putative transposase